MTHAVQKKLECLIHVKHGTPVVMWLVVYQSDMVVPTGVVLTLFSAYIHTIRKGGTLPLQSSEQEQDLAIYALIWPNCYVMWPNWLFKL